MDNSPRMRDQDMASHIGGAEPVTLLNSRPRHMRSGKPMDRPIIPADEIDDEIDGIQDERRRSRKLKSVAFKPVAWVDEGKSHAPRAQLVCREQCLGDMEDSIWEPGHLDNARDFMWTHAAAGCCGRNNSSNRNTRKSLLLPTAATTGATAAGAGVQPALDAIHAVHDVTDTVHGTVAVAHEAREWLEFGYRAYRSLFRE